MRIHADTDPKHWFILKNKHGYNTCETTNLAHSDVDVQCKTFRDFESLIWTELRQVASPDHQTLLEIISLTIRAPVRCIGNLCFSAVSTYAVPVTYVTKAKNRKAYLLFNPVLRSRNFYFRLRLRLKPTFRLQLQLQPYIGT